MNPSTPAAQINERDLSKNTAALRALLVHVEAPDLVVDVRYGLGGWAQALRERFPDAFLYGFEADRETFSRTWIGDHTTVYNLRSDQPGLDPGEPCDILLADFNTVTQLKRAELDAELERWKPRAIIFTDVACGKLHLNYRAYGLSEPDLATYWQLWPIEGYRLQAIEKHHHAASTGLFTRI
jgi:hypothetical protein